MCVNFHKFMIRTIMNGNKTRVYEVYEMKFASLATNVHEHVMYIHEHAPLNRNFSRDKKNAGLAVVIGYHWSLDLVEGTT